MQVYDEIELFAPDLLHQPYDAHYGPGLRPVPQSYTVNRNRRVRITGELHNGRAGLTHGDSDARHP